MSEAVVTGCGCKVFKDKLTAAISEVSREILEKGVRTNALTALAGPVRGLPRRPVSGARRRQS